MKIAMIARFDDAGEGANFLVGYVDGELMAGEAAYGKLGAAIGTGTAAALLGAVAKDLYISAMSLGEEAAAVNFGGAKHAVTGGEEVDLVVAAFHPKSPLRDDMEQVPRLFTRAMERAGWLEDTDFLVKLGLFGAFAEEPAEEPAPGPDA